MKNIVLILISVALNCTAQICMRQGMLQIGNVTQSFLVFASKLPLMASNMFLYLAVACYCASVFTWIAVLSCVEVSFAYPFLSLGYIVSLICGHFIFGENVSLARIAGVAIICVGVIFISRS